MRIIPNIRANNHSLTCFAGLSLAFGFLFFTTGLQGQDSSEQPGNLLETLKKRSAEDRWKRLKKLYPSDPPTPRRQTPSRLPEEYSQAIPEAELPPSPEQTPIIPRLSVLPVDRSNDWVLPSRQPAEAVPEPSTEVGSEVSGQSSAPFAVESASPQVTRLAQNPHSTDASSTAPNSKSLRERKISEINPYYDRERDSDMREFAVEKAKEMDIALTPKPFSERYFPQISLAWEASNFFFHPLYFSDPALERYGHTHHPLIQPAASIARAGVQFVFLPYQMVIDPPCKEEYALGFYRPGECAPKLHYQPPLNAEAAVVEAAVITGLYFVIP